MVNINSANEVGKLIGNALKSANNYKEDFIESEEVSDINLVGVEYVDAQDYEKVTKKFVTLCSISGVNGGVDPFVIDHPVNGNINGNFYIDGTYCSTEIILDTTTDLADFIVDESDNFLVDESGNFLIAI